MAQANAVGHLIASPRQVQELTDMLVPEALGLGVIEGQAKLIDDLRAHGNGVAPAVGADIGEDLLAKVAAKRWLD